MYHIIPIAFRKTDIRYGNATCMGTFHLSPIPIPYDPGFTPQTMGNLWDTTLVKHVQVYSLFTHSLATIPYTLIMQGN